MVSRRLGYLRLDPEGLARFTDDVLRIGSVRFPARFGIHARIPPALHRYLPAREELARLEEDLAAQYLLSSDFFEHDADESRTIRYLGYFDPYTRPCINPFVES